MTSIKRFWPEATVFGGIFTVFLMLCACDLTWVNTDCDGPHYLFASKYLHPAHKTSAPLFLMLGHLFLKIPYGLDAWRLAMLSVVASSITSVFIYLVIRLRTKSRWYGLIGAVVWGTSALVISQSTIIESYALVTLFGVMAYYFSIKKKWICTAVFLGLGLTVHPLAVFPLLVIFIANRDLRKWRYYGLTAAFLIFYIYIPITNRPPYMWFSPEELETNFLVDNISTVMMLVGGLAIWDVPKRIFDTAGILGVSLGLGFIVSLWWLWKAGRTEGIKGLLKKPLVWLFGLPIVFYATDLAPQTYVYMLPAIAFGAIIVGMALPRMKPYWRYGVIVVAIGLLAFNIQHLDVGRTLDPEMSARKFYNEELPTIPEDYIFLTPRGWEWAITFLYNAEENANIEVICEGILPSRDYQNLLREKGINFTVNPDDPLSALSANIAKSIVELNENVLTTRPTTPETYGAELVVAIDYIDEPSSYALITDGSMDMVWQWHPSNPYSIITGSIEVEEWIWITFSNYTVLTFFMMGMIGAVPIWFVYMVWRRGKRWSFGTAVGRVRNKEVTERW